MRDRVPDAVQMANPVRRHRVIPAHHEREGIVFHHQNSSHPDRPRPGRLRAQLSFANVAAGLALFMALGGTATAAVTLDRDSVGAPQIRKDGVRSPEVARDAVRSPEIAPDAVRSSEIQDESIKLADVASGTATALRGDLHVAENNNNPLDGVPACGGTDLSVCPDFLTLKLSSDTGSRTAVPAPPAEPGRNWLVEAKADVLSIKEVALVNRCGLVDTTETGPKAVLDEVRVFESGEDIALSAVVKKAAGNPTIALRCTSQDNSSGVDEVIPQNLKMTALEVGAVTGP
jgi:hypothetical protein